MNLIEIELLCRLQRTGHLPEPPLSDEKPEAHHVEHLYELGLIEPRSPDYAKVRHVHWYILPRGEAYLRCLLAMPFPTASTVWTVDTKPVHDVLERHNP